MFNLQGSEIVVILLLALVVLGPEKLPDAVRKFTQTYGEIKKMSSGFQSELKSALDEPMRELRDTANLVRDAADPRALLAPPDPTTEQPAPRPAPTTTASPPAFPAPDLRTSSDASPGISSVPNARTTPAAPTDPPVTER